MSISKLCAITDRAYPLLVWKTLSTCTWHAAQSIQWCSVFIRMVVLHVTLFPNVQAQYQFVYDAIVSYLESFEIYDNFAQY